MVVAMSCTDNWYHYLMVDLYSLLETTKSVKKVYLLISTKNETDLHYLNDIKSKFSVSIELINILDCLEKKINNSPNSNTIFSNFCFSKLLLSEFVEEDKVLYLDTDAIVRKDISALWKYDISDYYVAGVKDYGVYERGNLKELNYDGKYINSGVLLFNLKKIRKDNIQEKWFKLISERKLFFPDQDALNLVCNEKILYLPSMYNVCCGVTQPIYNKDLAKIYHFAGIKEDWVANMYSSEEWYAAEEKFYNEFGWYKY